MQNAKWLAAVVLSVLCARAEAQNVKTDEEKAFYSLGAMMGQRLNRDFSFSKAELEIVKKGFTDAATGKKLAVQPDTMNEKLSSIAQQRASKRAEKEKEKSKDFLAKAVAEKGATKTDSGLIYSELTPGTGASPKPTDMVKVHYKGTLIDGTEFDSSYKRNQPMELPLNGVIPCWTEGVQKMKVGGKSKLICPANIAYGDMGRPPTIPGGATLVFEIELQDIVAKKPDAAPAHAPPPAGKK
jgi:FKBP-type peptidyl-prolyl cis-trans isomerase FkpA